MVTTRRLRSVLGLSAATLLFAAAGGPAFAQTTRGAPVLRTPPRAGPGGPSTSPGTQPPASPPAPSPPAPIKPAAPSPGGAAPASPSPASPGAAAKPGAAGAAGTPAAPGATPAPAGDDPFAALKQGQREIDWKPKGGGFPVAFNLDEADLPELVKAISNITGKRFIYGGKLRQIKATVYSPEKVTAGEAYSAFLSILETNGMTVIPHGRFLKIIETPGIATQLTPIVGTATPVPGEERYVTRLYRLQHVDGTEVATLLGKFKSKDGDISVYGPGNLLIITDTGSNIQRMLRILEDVDVGGAGDQIYIEPIHYGSASDMASRLSDIFDLKKAGGGGAAPAAGKGASGGGPSTRIIADDRTNSLIIVANQNDYLRLLEIIKRIDVKQTGEGEIHVMPLQYAACKDLSQTLNQILGAAGGMMGAGARPPGQVGASPVSGAAGARSPNQALAEEVFEGRIRVTCDEATNSLVTTSSQRDYAQLRTVIDKLDHPRRQVFIEAVIMDVNMDRSMDLGLGYHGGAPFDVAGKQSLLLTGFNPKQSALVGLPSNLDAYALGVRGPEIEGSASLSGTGISIPAFGVVMHAIAQDGNSNVLATPHILATDNVAAEISIGQNIPLQTNIAGGLGGLGGLGATQGAAGAAGGLGALGALGGLGMMGGFNAQRLDVGTKIKVTPHVNDSDQVRLELVEEISEAGAPLGSLGAIPITKRTATTTLIVKDQQTVVIGGLMRDNITSGQTKVPILGDIPVLGLLFKQSQKKTQKTNLMLIMTPYVIREQDDLRGIFERKMQERQEFLDRYLVFSDSQPWEPPHDYSRTNGLVEDIRQAFFDVDEKVRIERESKPKTPRTHEPREPIQMPSFGNRRAAGGGGEDDGSGALRPGGARPSPKVSVPVPSAGSGAPKQVERVE
jgi:general secretion pathway protein D